MSNDNQNVDDGFYNCNLDDLVESEANGKKVVTWLLTIAEDKAAGMKLEKNHYLTSKKAADFLKKEFKKIEFDVKDSAEFNARKHGLIGQLVKVEKVTNEQGFAVFYIKGLVKRSVDKQQPPEDFGW